MYAIRVAGDVPSHESLRDSPEASPVRYYFS